MACLKKFDVPVNFANLAAANKVPTYSYICLFLPSPFKLGMAIPRRISFLEGSRSRGMSNLHSSGIEEDEIYSSGSSGNFEE